jgi:DNA repair exonuclease SbcCD ATPase subunit
MGVVRTLIFGIFAVGAAAAEAQVSEIYKCVDAKGRASYTNDRHETQGKKCELVTTQVNVAPAPKPLSRPAGSFPRESAAERASAKGRQREILEKELANEREQLAKARQALAEQEAVRFGDERNYARVLARLQPYKESVETHEKNIEALQREIGNLR